jgi:hypothetical protein
MMKEKQENLHSLGKEADHSPICPDSANGMADAHFGGLQVVCLVY